MTTRQATIQQLESDWAENPRWKGVERPYSAEDVVRLRGTVRIEHTLARLGAEKLWNHLRYQAPEMKCQLTGNKVYIKSLPTAFNIP